MKISSFLTSLSLLALPTFTAATTVAFDNAYDNPSAPLTSVACSDGENGLITRGFTTFGSLPKFPFIGGAAVVAGWNSPNCGTCWSISYTSRGKTNTIHMLAIDHSGSGFTLSQKAMDVLTGNRAAEVGRIDAATKQVAASVCGLK